MRPSLFRTASLVVIAIAAGAAAPEPSAPASPSPGQTVQTAPLTPQGREMAMRVEARIKLLHQRLHITSQQEDAFNAFAGVMRDNVRQVDQQIQARAAARDSMTALDSMRSYAQVTRAHADEIDRLVPAFQRLYESMTPEQRKEADDSFRTFSRQIEQRRG